MEILIVTLFNIDEQFLSHPDYPLNDHITNIAESFVDENHRMAAMFHDLGKLSDKFQKYIKNPILKSNTTHSLESAIIFLCWKNLELTPENFAIFISILKHHGNLEDINHFVYNRLSEFANSNRFEGKLKDICLKAKLNVDIDIDDFAELFDNAKFVEKTGLKGFNTYFLVKERFSKLIFADKYEAIFKSKYENINFDDTDEILKNLLKFIGSKTNKLAGIRNQARNEILQNFLINKEKRIFIIEAPTGLGKTFMALHLALEIVKTKNKKRIINALPMTSIIDQTHSEYSNAIDSGNLLKYHHLAHIKKYSNENFSEESSINQKDEYISSSWSYDKVIVTTFNQLFYSIFSNRNRDLIKFWTLRDSVIILDEIQAIPRILLHDIARVLNYLAINFNIDFVLMSATIPEIQRFLTPALTCELLRDSFYSMSFSNRYILKPDYKINNIVKLSEEIKSASKEYVSILAVVNTKKRALQLYELLEASFENEDIFLLNTNFIPKHREIIIANITNHLESLKKTIVIATQVIEAGVDLDFEYGFREFAPLSSIIQTAGRINREGKRSHQAYLVITDLLGFSPYQKKDLAENEVKAILPDELPENKVLGFLKQYFEKVIKKTSPDLLLSEDLEYLNFETAFKNFNKYFMTTIPSIKPIFVETEEGLYENYILERESIMTRLNKNSISLNEKMDLKRELKEWYKKISQYLININEKDAKDFCEFYKDSDLHFCPFDQVGNQSHVSYSFQKGWINGYDDFSII